ncbi:hypothetical protein SAMN05216327_1262 [Dyadobacter sp. SG02]|nr:hypothetical protein SAMN05216327_1262 [Dyadobacter sp. SG02]
MVATGRVNGKPDECAHYQISVYSENKGKINSGIQKTLLYIRSQAMTFLELRLGSLLLPDV